MRTKGPTSRDALSFAGYLKKPMYPVSCVLKKIEWSSSGEEKLSKLPSFRRLRHLLPIKLRFYVMSQHIVVVLAMCAAAAVRAAASPTCATLQRVTRNASCLNSYCYKSAALAMLVFIGESSEQIGNS